MRALVLLAGFFLLGAVLLMVMAVLDWLLVTHCSLRGQPGSRVRS
ncbi:hypothetical protein [Streptomyces sp. LN785]